ncbi:MAG: sulfatase [Bryobacterales bacterium]|nr:sulfatase [Bryobacterales bacterium]
MNSSRVSRRSFLRSCAAAAITAPHLLAADRPPNIVLILADDLGYGDLGCYGSKIETPACDRIAQEGMRFTDYYAASPLCSPSRAALLTGCYPPRTGVPRVLVPDDTYGLTAGIPTIGGTLQSRGYRAKCVGKWHVGTKPESHPLRQGFDEFYGIPFSHDMEPLSLIRNADVIEQSPKCETLTSRFTDQAVEFIRRADERPFFLYLAHTAPHIPLAPSTRFAKRSRLGAYGDVVSELDSGIGEVMKALDDSGHSRDTLVIVTSDNGPWYQGSTGPLHGRKGDNYEGGTRVPLLARMPGVIPQGTVSNQPSAAIDLLPTIAAITGSPIPAGLDGADLSPLLRGDRAQIDRGLLLYFDIYAIQCARLGKWKAHFSRWNANRWSDPPANGLRNLPLPRPELYDLESDPGESYNLAAQNSEVVADIRARVEAMLPSFSKDVAGAWYGTFNMPVEDTPEGARPRPRTP